MGKSAAIFHSWGSQPQDHWYEWLGGRLEEQGYDVWIPELPIEEKPDLALQLPFVLKRGEYDEKSVLIGHSSGVPLILALLEKLETPVALSVLVAGFVDPASNGREEPILKDTYDWDKIGQTSGDFLIVNAQNDPYECNEAQGMKLWQKLGGRLVLDDTGGHFGSKNEPLKEFPLLLKLLSLSIFLKT